MARTSSRAGERLATSSVSTTCARLDAGEEKGGGSRESHGRSAGERGLGVRRCRAGRRTPRRRDHRGKGARAPRSSSGAGEGRVRRLLRIGRAGRAGAPAGPARPRCHHLPLAPCAASRRCQKGWAAARPQRRGPAGRPGECWRRLRPKGAAPRGPGEAHEHVLVDTPSPPVRGTSFLNEVPDSSADSLKPHYEIGRCLDISP